MGIKTLLLNSVDTVNRIPEREGYCQAEDTNKDFPGAPIIGLDKGGLDDCIANLQNK